MGAATWLEAYWVNVMKSPVVGKWRIIEMGNWDKDYFDMEVPAYFMFKSNGMGDFQFGLVQGELDGRWTIRDGLSAIEFTWEGSDEADPVTGRGWASVHADGKLHGQIFFHLGEESTFVAKRKK